ncbi:LLM class flavin-dependent oxidoreductase [Microbacterium sp. No. 7]|uniref:LLM class flavin-dependent oxidoreductase n=1 Tax=Microbacterium sp. No. 7 TaxID=1714373 RepID=UPI0006CF89EA|nr:LLM class flavin-dependent oxidoreductase [Microbacterium sp. No. 7]ALJ18813.1 hypothetical protein AOA12_02345 [Microbacterium sp. No. 7]
MTPPSLGIALRRGPVGQLVQQARSLHDAGLDTLWIADHITGFPVDAPVFEPFTALAALSGAVPGRQLGVAVTDAFRRNPAVLAQQAMTVQAMTGAPLLLGIGSGEAMNLAPYGIARERPLARLRDTVRALRALGTSSIDRPVTLDGEGVRLRDAYLQQPAGARPPQILLGTNGPRGKRLVGEIADGWLPIMLTPELLREDVAGIRRAAETAGRDPAGIRVVYHAYLAVADDRAAGLRMVAGGLTSVLLGFPHLAERLGAAVSRDFDWGLLEVTSDVARRIDDAAARIPDEVVRRVAVYGSPSECAETIAEYADAGATDIIFRTVNPLDELTDALRAVARAVRGASGGTRAEGPSREGRG